jgi:thiamine biosynthesis lipoprotein
MQELLFEKDLFGGKISIALSDVDEKLGNEILEDAYKEALKLQKIFNFYDKESELSKLNQKRELKVSEHLFNVISMALELSRKTEGQYDITLGKNILERKSSQQIKKHSGSYTDIMLKKDQTIILKHPDILIDLGSIAKGYIADQVAEFIKLNGIENGMIDARGDIVFFGDDKNIIEIQHPRDKYKSVCTIKLQNESVATSGDYQQFYGDYSNSHILNKKDVISVTIVAPTLVEADAYATALFVCTDEQRKMLLEENKNIKVLLINEQLDLKMYNGFDEIIES